MCNTTNPSSSSSSSSSPPSLISFKKSSQLLHPMDGGGDLHDSDLLSSPSLSKVAAEVRAIGRVSVPTALTGLVMYSRAMISMLFLGHLGELALAGGSLALGFANITGYSVLSGLALGMEPVCGQAFGARRGKLLALALHRTVLLLLAVSLPIAALWLVGTGAILRLLGQDASVAAAAQTFAAYAAPDLAVLAVLHPLRVYLRSQNLTLPIAGCSIFSVLLHVPINYLLVVRLRMGVAGVALAVVLTDLNLLVSLACFLVISGAHRDSWVAPTSVECLRGWPAMLRLAVPTAAAVCLEWWWYELMIVLSGLLANPQATVASMGVLIQATSLVYVFPSALGQGASTRVSHQLGAGRPAGARRAARVALALGAAMGAVAAAFMVSVRRHWGRMFTSDGDILELTAVALPIAGLCELGNCPQTGGCGVLRGSARPAMGAHINLAAFYLVGMPVGVLLSFGLRLGFAGLWLGLLAAQAACACSMAYAVAATDWDVEVARAKELIKPNPTCNSNAIDSCSPTVTASSNNGYMPIGGSNTDGEEGNSKKLERLEEGLMSCCSNNGVVSSNSKISGCVTSTVLEEREKEALESLSLIAVGDGDLDHGDEQVQ